MKTVMKTFMVGEKSRVESQPVVYEIVRCDVPRINLFCDW
jgi:hypothetical protein